MTILRSLFQRMPKFNVASQTKENEIQQTQKTMDLAIIGGRGYHSSYGGVENAIRQISNHMVESYSLNITVYGTDPSEYEEGISTNAKLSFVYAPSFVYRKFGQHGATLACVLHALIIGRPSVTLIFASGPSIFVPLFRLFGIPVVTSLRAIDSARDKWGWLSRKILQLGEYFSWRYAHAFTANSLEMVEVFGSKRKDAVFIPNGSTKATDRDSDILAEHNLSDGSYFLFAARLDPVKRLHILLEAHASLPESSRLPLLIAGGHSKSEKYQQELMEYASSDVIFLGHISAAQLDPLMVHCRAFLLPSVLEGMSNSLLSAMATGCAVLASDIPANADVLDSQDAVFPVDDIDALREGLKKLAQQSDFADQLGARLQDHAESTYSWQRTTDLFYSQLSPYLTKENEHA